jgi:hypothetical protein
MRDAKPRRPRLRNRRARARRRRERAPATGAAVRGSTDDAAGRARCAAATAGVLLRLPTR